MATQYAPIAKDSSINTTENTPRNIADVLAEELSAIEQAIAGGSGSGGHTIVNASGTDMTQREKMQFVDAGVTDDSANDKTKVEIVQTISAESDLTNAPDGVYQGTWDEDPSDALTADMVGYGSGTVEDALNGSVKVKILTYSVTTGSSNTHYFNNGTANIAKGQVALSSHADYPSTAVGAIAVSARSSSGYSIALPAIEGNAYVAAYGSTNMTVNVSVLVFYT